MQLTKFDLVICYSLALEAKEILDRAEVIQSMAERISPQYSEMPKARGVSDKVGDSVASLLDFWERQKEVAKKYLEHVGVVERAIATLEDSQQRRVLRYRYVDGLTWREIQLLMHYSERWIFDTHRKGLKNLGIEENQQ